MQFRKFKQNKLWRDKLIEAMENKGSKIHFNILNDAEYIEQLKIKFLEEAQEVAQAKTKEQLLEELADILEVIAAIAKIYNFSLEDVQRIQQKKFNERGGFYSKKFITIAEHQVGSFGEQYCLKDPEKYPEIKN